MSRYYLWSIGCQMNDADAAVLRRGFGEMGFWPVSDPREADVVVLITCVVRQRAEGKVVGRLTSLKNLKRSRPEALIAVMGCFVDDESSLRTRFPYVDAFFKPSDSAGLLQLVRERMPTPAGEVNQAVVALPARQPVCALVPISYGCDHHCTYCIVRLRRGRQQSRPLGDIVSDVQEWVRRGARQVTLLGQNVDAYGQDLGPDGPSLADVLAAVHEVDGLWRIRFLTSHPGDMTHELIDTVARLPKVCPHFEVPVQAGDDRILKRMGRNYTVARYQELVTAIRQWATPCSIATDVIVGFPGESDAEFQATYDLLASLRLDSVHIAKYSPRPGTPAARLPDDVPAEEKERRRSLLEELQTQIAGEINSSLLGQTVDVLVQERQRGRWKGRTVTNKLVFFEDTANQRGHLVRVRITWAGPWSLIGQPAG
jgi:tRNA-2-methylthio-N6-dimethylallyladenosine synthase